MNPISMGRRSFARGLVALAAVPVAGAFVAAGQAAPLAEPETAMSEVDVDRALVEGIGDMLTQMPLEVQVLWVMHRFDTAPYEDQQWFLARLRESGPGLTKMADALERRRAAIAARRGA
jgi:hypothetical protein